MILGEYVGPEDYAAEAVIHSRRKHDPPMPTKALHDMLSIHATSPKTSCVTNNDDPLNCSNDVLRDLTVSDVHQELAKHGVIDTLWKVLTPEAASGAEATFVNLAIIPRTVQHADLEGNLRDDGRRNVALTRSRLFTSTHVSAESLHASKIHVGGDIIFYPTNIVATRNLKGRFGLRSFVCL